jgi:hypothetical protein
MALKCGQDPFFKERWMPTFAQVGPGVSYTPGDGVPLPIPPGRVEVQLSEDSATLSWEAEPGVAAVTAIPRTQFDDYVQAGQIRWTSR